SLHVAHAPADELGDVGDPVDGAVHHVEVEAAGEPRPAAHERGRAVDQPVDHVEVEPGRRAAEEQRAAHEQQAVELVDPVRVDTGTVMTGGESGRWCRVSRSARHVPKKTMNTWRNM